MKKPEWIDAGFYEDNIHTAWEERKLWRCSRCGNIVHSARKPDYDCKICKRSDYYEYEFTPSSKRFIRVKL